jgi:receptor-type tyrosine-protein phosphatase N
VPVESRERDWILVPTLVVCSFVVFVLVALLAVYAIRHQQRRRRQVDDFEARPSRAYQELCRQRMGAKTTDGGIGRFVSSSSAYGDQQQPTSKTSSTSSWCEEPIQQSNMDITTGHIILSYLEEYLKSQQTLDAEWSALELYRNLNATTDIAKLSENQDKNRFQDVLPYDHTLIRLQYGADADIAQCGEYINASMLYDSDPRTAVYIATQAPMLTTAAEFWQMVWEQGAVVIVNLTKLSEKCHRYWPDNGSEVLGVFEVHLVSEHIWSEDYLVRSFYLKNLRTNETRTVTQFHFVSWPDTNIPNAKALLEFRRKVNKSYRGRLSPIIVHCSDGAGRTGTYCLLDMVLNRINKGVKELDIAASLEHLRDQRPNMVQTKEQYKFVVCCVAEEVNAMLKALPQ